MEKQENKKEPKKASGKKTTGKKPRKRTDQGSKERVVATIGIIGIGADDSPLAAALALHFGGMIGGRLGDIIGMKKKDILPLEGVFKLKASEILGTDDLILALDGESVLKGLHTDETKTQTILDASEKAYGKGTLSSREAILLSMRIITAQEFAKAKLDKSLPFPPAVIATTKDGEDLIQAIREGVTEGKLGELIKEIVTCANSPLPSTVEHLTQATALGERLEMTIDLDAIWQTREIFKELAGRHEKEAKEALQAEGSTYETFGNLLLKARLADFLLEQIERTMLEHLPYAAYRLKDSESDIVLVPTKFDPSKITLKGLNSAIVHIIGGLPEFLSDL